MVGEVVEVAALGALEGAEVGGGVAVGRIHLDWILILILIKESQWVLLIIVNHFT